MGRLKRFIQNRPLRTKMIAACFLLLFLPSSIFTYYSVRHVDQVIQEQTFSAAEKAFEEAVTTLNARINKAVTVMDKLRFNALIYRMVSTDPAHYAPSEQLGDLRTLGAQMDDLTQLSEASEIRLYVKNEYLYTRENQHVFPMAEIADASLFGLLQNGAENAWFTPLDVPDGLLAANPSFVCLRPLYDAGAQGSPLALMCVALTQSELEQAIGHSATTANGVVFLFSAGRPVISYASAGAEDLPDGIFPQLSRLADGQWDSADAEGTDYYVYSAALDAADWRLVTVIPQSDITAFGRKLENRMMAVTLGVTLAAFLVAIAISRSFTRRIWQLEGSMRSVSRGDVHAHVSDDSADEIGQLAGHFNDMMERIDQLMKEKVRYGAEIKSLELKALQAQINPHFLYNTLDTINCFALQKGAQEIRDVVSALAAFYKISLSNGEDEIPIREEIRHAKMYLTILDYRFSSRVETEWDVDPELEERYIVKTILQPIIENAVIHGIFEKEIPSGRITVRAWREENDILFTVEDDGVGMSEERLRANFGTDVSPSATSAAGYGLRNINNRLRLVYGPEYGLSCESSPGRGTKVTIRIADKNSASSGEAEREIG